MQITQHDVLRFEPSLAIAEHPADGLLSQWATAGLRPFRHPRAVGQAERAMQRAAQARAHYAQHQLEQKERTRRYKVAHPQRKRAMDAARNARIHAQSDGTASPAAIKKLKAATTHCSYCDERLFSKQTDHMITLALGGEHSLRNIVIVCPECNLTKHKLSYEEWIERVDPRHRARVIALFESRHESQHELRAAA